MTSKFAIPICVCMALVMSALLILAIYRGQEPTTAGQESATSEQIDYTFTENDKVEPIMQQVPVRLSENNTSSNIGPPWPDLDLHAYTSAGEHVGVNYETENYEVGIPNTIASGDYWNGSEYMYLPFDREIYFTVSSRDVAEFLENNPGAQFEFENGIYAICAVYIDENGKRWQSEPIGQVIQWGEEIAHHFKIMRNSDGTFSTTVEAGTPVLS